MKLSVTKKQLAGTWTVRKFGGRRVYVLVDKDSKLTGWYLGYSYFTTELPVEGMTLVRVGSERLKTSANDLVGSMDDMREHEHSLVSQAAQKQEKAWKNRVKREFDVDI